MRFEQSTHILKDSSGLKDIRTYILSCQNNYVFIHHRRRTSSDMAILIVTSRGLIEISKGERELDRVHLFLKECEETQISKNKARIETVRKMNERSRKLKKKANCIDHIKTQNY